MENSDEFVSFFPDFVWTLRDFSLELKVNGEPISADEYLENSLKLIHNTDKKEKVQKLNLPRLCIQKFFPKKKCFVFERPAHGKKLSQLQSLQDEDLDSDFLEQVAEFCSYVFSCSKVKALSGGIKVNGPRLKSLVITYVNTISSGGLPCVENAVLALSQTENAAAVQKAIAHYDQQMSQMLELPTETLQELLDLHGASEKEATKIFMENSFKDIDQVFQMELRTKLETKREEFLKKNEQASSDRCAALLQGIFSPLEKDVKQGIYSKPGGYCLYIQKIEELKKKYSEEPRKGVQAEEALKQFLQSKEEVTNAILHTDQVLTQKEKAMEEQRVKAEAAQATAKFLEERQRQSEQLMKEKEKLHQEHMKQVAEKMEKAQAQMREEQRRAMEHQLQEQARLLRERFQEEIRRAEEERMKLQQRKSKRKWYKL